MQKNLILLSLLLTVVGYDQVMAQTSQVDNNICAVKKQCVNDVIIKNSEIINHRLLRTKLFELSKEFVKDNFETKKEFEDRKSKLIDKFYLDNEVNLRGVLISTFPMNITLNDWSSWSYDPETKQLFLNPNGGSSYDLKKLGFQPRFLLFGPQKSSLINLILDNNQAKFNDYYWQNKEGKFASNNNEKIVINNLEPDLAKEILEENRLYFKVFFKPTYPFLKNYNNILGNLENVQIMDQKTKKILWSLE